MDAAAVAGRRWLLMTGAVGLSKGAYQTALTCLYDWCWCSTTAAGKLSQIAAGR